MTTLPHPSRASAPTPAPVQAVAPSSVAARLSLAFSLVAVIGLFLFPFGTYTRNFNAAATVQRFPAGVLDYTGFAPQVTQALPGVTAALTAGWVTLAALLLTLVFALRQSRWLWTAGLVALLGSVAAIALFGHALSAEVAAELARGERLRRIPYASGGPSMALLFTTLAGLVTLLAGLSQYSPWWARLNRLRGLLVPLVAVALAILVGALVVLIVQRVPADPSVTLTPFARVVGKADVVWFVYSTLFAPLTSLGDFFDSLKIATPLIFTGLSVAFAFRTGLFNVGASGQLTAGAVGAMLVGVYAPLPGPLLLVASVLAAALGGAIWGAIPGLLKARFGSSEVINTIMLNYIASAIFVFLLGSNTFPFLGRQYALPFKAPGFEAKSLPLQAGARLEPLAQFLGLNGAGPGLLTVGPFVALAAFLAVFYLWRNRLRVPVAVVAAAVLGALTWRIGIPVQVTGTLGASRLNTSFLIAAAAVVLFSVLLWRTSSGYALRAVGLSPKAAEYGGVSVARNTVLAMTLAGAFAGLAGTHYVMGGALDEYALKQNLPVSVGFDGITVALMGQSTPIGVLVSSVLFGTLDTGAVFVTTKLQAVNKDIVTVLKALIVLFIAAGGFLGRRVTDPPPPQLLASGNTAGGGVPLTVGPDSAAPPPQVTANTVQGQMPGNSSLETEPGHRPTDAAGAAGRPEDR